MVKIKQLPMHQRPREKLIEKGPSGLSDAELLAIILRTGIKGRSAIQLADELLIKIPLNKILSSNLHDFKQIKGLGTAKITQLIAAVELAKRAKESPTEVALTNPERVANLLADYKTKKKEYFLAIYLNARHFLLHKEIVSIGHLTGSLVHPREVFAPAFKNSAVSVILAHNHPSGDPTPSPDDIQLTQRIIDAGKILDISILDHIIVTKNDWVSMKQMGYIQ